MNKWCFLLIAACLLAPDTGHAALKARDDVKAEDAFTLPTARHARTGLFTPPGIKF